MGMRLPGTYLPGVIAAGTYYNNGDKQFVAVARKTHLVVIERAEGGFARIVLGFADAPRWRRERQGRRRQGDRINDALTRQY